MILGLDVSTSIVGFCLLDKDGSLVKTWYADLRKIKEFTSKAQSVVNLLDEVRTRDDHENIYKVRHVFIEEALAGFARGGSMQQTMLKLASFNGAVTYAVYGETWIKPVHIHPSTVKAIMKREGLIIPKGVKGKDKKLVTLKWVMEQEPDFPYDTNRNDNPQPWCFDQADAYCVAKAGYLKHACE